MNQYYVHWLLAIVNISFDRKLNISEVVYATRKSINILINSNTSA